jgi:outer membrane protein OmpA-like peptidoglycan-associated protein
MALTDENSGMVMPVQPMGGYNYGIPYGGNFGGGMFGNGNDWLGLLFLIALCNGGWGGFGGFGGWGGMMGMGMMGMDYLYPWLNNSQNINNGFRDQQLNNQISDARGDINRGFADVQLGIAGINQSICQTGNGITAAVNNGFSQAEIAANGRQMANMQQAFANQQAMSQGFNGIGLQLCQAAGDNRLATANLGADIAREACATRTSDTQNTQVILNAINDGFRAMSDQRYQDKIDAKNDEIAQLRQENLYARGQASQIAQNTQIVDGIYSRLSSCPVGTVPVAGNTPLFSCNPGFNGNNSGCGCNSNGGF